MIMFRHIVLVHNALNSFSLGLDNSKNNAIMLKHSIFIPVVVYSYVCVLVGYVHRTEVKAQEWRQRIHDDK